MESLNLHESSTAEPTELSQLPSVFPEYIQQQETIVCFLGNRVHLLTTASVVFTAVVWLHLDLQWARYCT